MKKAVLTVFSISLTAGTLYLAYSGGKSFYINKMIKSWSQESAKQKKELTLQQIDHLKEELDKLYLWEVKQLYNYSEKALAKASEKEITPMIEKLKSKKILEKADLKAVDTILFGS